MHFNLKFVSVHSFRYVLLFFSTLQLPLLSLPSQVFSPVLFCPCMIIGLFSRCGNENTDQYGKKQRKRFLLIRSFAELSHFHKPIKRHKHSDIGGKPRIKKRTRINYWGEKIITFKFYYNFCIFLLFDIRVSQVVAFASVSDGFDAFKAMSRCVQCAQCTYIYT